MPKYKVGNKSFNTFDEVVTFAWNEQKIDLNYHDVMDEDMMQQACEELTKILEEL